MNVALCPRALALVTSPQMSHATGPAQTSSRSFQTCAAASDKAAVASSVVTVALPDEPRDDLLEHRVRPRVQLVEREELHGMRDVDHAVVRHPEQARLLERLVEEWLGRHRRRGDSEPLEPDHVVHTARRAGASIGEALHRQVATVGDAADELGLGGLGEDLLGDAERLGAVLA